jgi:hypothetical protein
MIYRLIYCSTATDRATSGKLEALFAQSATYNQQHDISGILVVNSRFFLQALEGGREVVNDLYGRIAKDERNEHVVLIKYEQVSSRLWDNWSHLQIMPTANMPSLLRRYSTQSHFNPYTLHPNSAEQLLVDLAAQVAVN